MNHEPLFPRLLRCIGLCVALTLVVITLGHIGASIPAVSQIIEHNRTENIETSALFYTESQRALDHSAPELPND